MKAITTKKPARLTPEQVKVKVENDARIYQFEQAAQFICDLSRSGNAYALRKMARVAVQLTECMNELLSGDIQAQVLKCWKPIFAELPSMPVMKHHHGGDMQAIQERLDLLKVGSKLGYNIDHDAKFKPHTPINTYITGCLVHLHQVRDYIDSRLKSKRKEGRDNPHISSG